jgi:hypothetical protein
MAVALYAVFKQDTVLALGTAAIAARRWIGLGVYFFTLSVRG